MPMRILVVEDEPDLNDVITKKLVSEHYTVDSCADGSDAIHYIDCAEYDAILLDIMLPGIGGLDVLGTIRNRGDKTPVLLLTARDSIEDRVAGLDGGADDYLVKPFAFDELLARVRAMIRRSSDHTSNVFTAADLTVDCDSREVTRAGVPVPLSGKEFAILEYMIRNQGIVLTRERISQHIWNYDYEGGSNVIDVYIRYLRKKIDEGRPRKLIHTIRGTGYALRADE
jgi:two-component system copper resistance phosphate regulon response regulator CusR